MIASLKGTLISKDLDRVEVMTAGGVGYTLTVALGTYETLPKVGDEVTLHTHLVVRDDAWLLFGFATTYEKRVFERVLSAQGIGPALAIGMLSALSADRLVRAIREKDIPTLQGVPRVGRKKAERLILDLADKLDDVQGETAARVARPEGASADDAIRALVSLGYTMADAERAVRKALDEGPRGMTAPELIRSSLAKVGER
ncbi:MAG: Holliday junction branch migration protein RuvA [Gemmatimonadota bacterium]|nr:Holliday junction branch migration protein RuvA [Gemmatimonadota bacterium]